MGASLEFGEFPPPPPPGNETMDPPLTGIATLNGILIES